MFLLLYYFLKPSERKGGMLCKSIWNFLEFLQYGNCTISEYIMVGLKAVLCIFFKAPAIYPRNFCTHAPVNFHTSSLYLERNALTKHENHTHKQIGSPRLQLASFTLLSLSQRSGFGKDFAFLIFQKEFSFSQ